VRTDGEWLRCVNHKQLANSVSHVFTGWCPNTGEVIRVQRVTRLRGCGIERRSSQEVVCNEVSYDGQASRVEIDLK